MNKTSELGANPQTTGNHSPSAITMYKQPRERSDDQLRQSVTCRSLHNKKCNPKLTTGCFLGLEIKRKPQQPEVTKC